MNYGGLAFVVFVLAFPLFKRHFAKIVYASILTAYILFFNRGGCHKTKEVA